MEVSAGTKFAKKETNTGVSKCLNKKKMCEKRQTRVKVVIRVRPPLKAESKVCIGTTDRQVEIFNHRNIKENLQYEFTSVYDEGCGQREIFEGCVRPLLGHALKGENVSIFAYGPTGAGKTYTMLGTEDDPGMIPRVIHTLFHSLVPSDLPVATGSGPRPSHRVTFSYFEIYNEKVQDLLNPSETDLPIREDSSHNIFVAGLTEKDISSFDDFKKLFGPASKNRTVAATKLNDRSSRSHCLVQLKVDCRRNNQVYHGKIYLIDLAGSEDNRRTGNSGLRLKESGAINKSLFVLGEVVDAINNNLPRIPYRNSKLTRLLQDSIGGSCRSVMITNVAPEESFYYDTYCTLNFATKSRKVVNSNVASISFDRPAEARSLKRSSSQSTVCGDQKSKRAKLSSGSTSDDLTPPATLAPLQPLVQRQDQLERTVHGCMRRVEDLVQQLHRPPSAASAPDMDSIQRQLHQVQAQLHAIQQQQGRQASGPQKSPSDSGPKSGRRKSSSAPATKAAQLKSSSNARRTSGEQKSSDAGLKQSSKPGRKLYTEHGLERRRSLRNAFPSIDSVLKDQTNKGGAHSSLRMSEEPSCSPLFVTAPSSVSGRFQKGFKSTACAAPLVPTTPHKFKADVANFTTQHKKQNEEFLGLLNTAPVKDLQQLHTVGTKRARLIFEWRETHGTFTSFEDLRAIPGFTDKYIHSLLQRNFVLVDV